MIFFPNFFDTLRQNSHALHVYPIFYFLSFTIVFLAKGILILFLKSDIANILLWNIIKTQCMSSVLLLLPPVAVNYLISMVILLLGILEFSVFWVWIFCPATVEYTVKKNQKLVTAIVGHFYSI